MRCSRVRSAASIAERNTSHRRGIHDNARDGERVRARLEQEQAREVRDRETHAADVNGADPPRPVVTPLEYEVRPMQKKATAPAAEATRIQ